MHAGALEHPLPPVRTRGVRRFLPSRVLHAHRGTRSNLTQCQRGAVPGPVEAEGDAHDPVLRVRKVQPQLYGPDVAVGQHAGGHGGGWVVHVRRIPLNKNNFSRLIGLYYIEMSVCFG